MLFEGLSYQRRFSSINRHGINFAIALIDIILSRTVFKFINIIFFVIYALAYLAFAWIRFAVVDNFPYGFLDFEIEYTKIAKKPLDVVRTYAILVAAGISIGFLIAGITKLKKCYARRPSKVSDRDAKMIA